MPTALIEERKAKQRERWLTEYHEAVIAYNDYVEGRGVFSDGVRDF